MSKQPLEDQATGVHRAHVWEIGFYSLNNLSTNLYGCLMGSISYYLVGIVGIGVVLAGSIVTIMRVWDGVTDPFAGMIVDHTNTKFGKNRPFIVLGNVILFVTTFLMFNIIPRTGTSIRFILFLVLYMLYIIGYTFQCVVTKSAQTCITNDPKQRPMFAMFDAVGVTVLYSIAYPILLANYLIPTYTITTAESASEIEAFIAQNPNLVNQLVTDEETGISTLSGYYNPEMWTFFQLVVAGLAAVCAVLAIIGIARKDNEKYFPATNETSVGIKDYVDVIAHNRAIQMLVVAASTDKLSSSCKSNTTVMACLWGVIFGSYAMYSANAAITAVPLLVVSLCLMNKVARYMGQKKCLVIGTYGCMICGVISIILIVCGANNGAMSLPSFSLTDPSTWASIFTGWSILGVIWVLNAIMLGSFSNMAGQIVIPMTADCADYEVYRSGRYVPGLMGTLFSFVDKLISSLASTIVALCFATIGYTDTLPTNSSPYSTGILYVTIFCFVGMPMLGWICNLIAMKFYPLTKEKMEEIQDDIARIKAEAAAQAKG